MPKFHFGFQVRPSSPLRQEHLHNNFSIDGLNGTRRDFRHSDCHDSHSINGKYQLKN